MHCGDSYNNRKECSSDGKKWANSSCHRSGRPRIYFSCLLLAAQYPHNSLNDRFTQMQTGHGQVDYALHQTLGYWAIPINITKHRSTCQLGGTTRCIQTFSEKQLTRHFWIFNMDRKKPIAMPAPLSSLWYAQAMAACFHQPPR